MLCILKAFTILAKTISINCDSNFYNETNK